MELKSALTTAIAEDSPLAWPDSALTYGINSA